MGILIHKNSLTEWLFLDEFKPQFSTASFVRLKNVKSGKIESFNASTYKHYFKN